MRCGSCGELDYSVAYLTDPPQYKCDKYGCIVRIDATCKGKDQKNSGRKQMFDIIEYALKNNVAIVIDPYTETGLRITIGTGVLTAENATTVDCGFHLETEPEKAQEACEMILGMIRAKNKHMLNNIHNSRKRAEMEKFWKESIPIMGRE